MNTFKHVLLLCAATVLGTLTVQAQSAKYMEAMKAAIAPIDTAHSVSTYQELGNTFQRIADAEKTQALPYYYAAFCKVMTSLLAGDHSNDDAIADNADSLITKAEALDKPTSETFVIRSMIATSHLLVDPQNRYQEYGEASATALQKAEALDSTNPRPIFLEGQSKFFTPEAYGGGKAVAKPLLEKAVAMYKAFRPASDLAPTWGERAAEYFLSQCN